MYPSLPKSYKSTFPFTVATTSFIYPDHYVQNVHMLAPYLDEIELIFFESAPNSLPTKDEIGILLSIANEYGLSYNVHHPLDIFPGAQDRSRRQFAVETIRQIIDLTAPISPSTHTIHLPYERIDHKNESLKRWQENVYESMEALHETGITGKMISVETLNYPMEWVKYILMDFNLSVCMDLGHLIIYGFDMKKIFARYHDKTSIIHLHGANDGRDHQVLDLLSKADLKTILDILKRFNGIVSLEVFSYGHLLASLNFLEKVWMKT
jgi:adenosylcobalamin phosphodiesterase